MTITIRTLQWEDLNDFNACYEDIMEIWASSRRTPIEAIRRAGALSKVTNSVFQDGVLMGVFGVGIADLQQSHRGCVWFIRTERFCEINRKEFMRLSTKWSDEFLSQFEMIENLVWTKNIQSIRWLQSLGFTRGETVVIDHGAGALPQNFIHLYKRQPECVTS